MCSKQQACSSKHAASCKQHVHKCQDGHLHTTSCCELLQIDHGMTYRWVMLWLQKVLQTKLCRLVFEEQQPAQKACCGKEGQKLNQQAGNKQYSNLQGLAARCRE